MCSFRNFRIISVNLLLDHPTIYGHFARNFHKKKNLNIF